MGKRGKQNWSKDKLPIGTIRLRTRSRGALTVRFIKFTNRYDSGRNWKPLARYRWERKHGPVPPGMVVAHLDGDCLNDDFANYGLRTPGEVAQIHHARDAAMSASNRAQCRATLAAWNRLRSRLCRRTRGCRSGWFLVHPARRTIVDRVFKSRRQAFAHVGVRVARNGRGTIASEWEVIRAARLSDTRYASYQFVEAAAATSFNQKRNSA